MKSIIVYYSYSGNTRNVAYVLAEYLKQRSAVEILELKPQDESNSFLGQCRRAFWHKRAAIPSKDFDLAPYDVICLGTPVWAFGPAPAVNTFLDSCSGTAGKECVLFTTYGSGTGNQRCLNYMRDGLRKQGATAFKEFSIQQNKVSDKEFVLSAIKGTLL